MSKSIGNFITLEQFFKGDHPLLSRAYSPMAIRFFILQAHYRSTLDFSDDALQAADKGYKRLMTVFNTLEEITPGNSTTGFSVADWKQSGLGVLLDDFNTPLLLANLFEGVTFVNKVKAGQETISSADLHEVKQYFREICQHVLGLEEEVAAEDRKILIDGLIALLVEQRSEAKTRKDFATSDALRDKLKAIGVQLKDGKEGTSWEIES
jgi:cysteinyl-tRNA synthetase